MKAAVDWRARFAALDASQPGFAPYAGPIDRCRAALAQGEDVVAALNGAGPLRFVSAACAPAGEPYEAFIARSAAVPTRNNLHDLFNGLVWLRFPHAKRRLNQMQAAQIARAGVQPTRGPLRDALTLFDESGAVLDAPPALWQALLAHDWRRLFVTERALWRGARLLVFGHALLEKLLCERKAATAHVLLAQGAIKSIANDDLGIAAALQPAHLADKPFTPLPLFGVPGWWHENENFCFYDDSEVFRPRA